MTDPAFIALGSNIEPQKYLPRAVEMLTQLGIITAISTVYQNPAINRPDQDDYLNAAVLLQTELSAEQLRGAFRKIEEHLDRIRKDDRYAARTIDLDLAFLGSVILSTARMTLPDPDIDTRPFLALTLSELDPEMIHPISKKSLAQISSELAPQVMIQSRPDVTMALLKAAGLNPPL